MTIEDIAPGGLATSLGYDANGRLTTLGQPGTDTPLLSFTYDNLDRLTETRDGPTGTVLESYRYDLTGNRLAFTDAHGEQAYAYPADSHRLIGVAGQERRYDAMGNLIADDGRGRQFIYNAMGRMAEVRQGASVLRRYAYNAWGEQVSKTDGTETGTTLTLYDEAGHWLGDYNAHGQSAQQAIWLDDYPVGLIQAGHTYYLETDHLGTPRVAIDPARDVAVWRWDLKGEAFGSTAPDEDPDRDGAAFVLDMRFPGQRYDRVTGLYYNYQRDYDYLIGRYVQSDPIGLFGGVGGYVYVSGKPLILIDPYGEYGLVGAIYGAIAGGVGGYITSGTWQGTLAGATAGGFVGAINPFAANAVGSAAGAAAASLLGQAVGIYTQDKDLDDACNYDFIAAAGAAAGGVFGGPANHFLGRFVDPIRRSVIGRTVGSPTLIRAPGRSLGALTEGAITGISELLGSKVQNKATKQCGCARN